MSNPKIVKNSIKTALTSLITVSILATGLTGANATPTLNYDITKLWYKKALNYSPTIPYTGHGVKIAVLDTGVDGTHVGLQGKVLEGFDIVEFKPIPAGTNSDIDGHGTHVAGLIAGDDPTTNFKGLAPGAQIIPVKVIGANLSGIENPVAAGIYWASINGADIINMSLGAFDIEDTLIAAEMCEAVAYARSKNIVVIAASGNNGFLENPQVYPSTCEGVISVSAVNQFMKPAWFSTYDPNVSIAAPGVNIVSTVPTKETQNYNILGYSSLSGTSMAAPIVTATVALLQESGVQPEDMLQVLQNSATDIQPLGMDPFTGAGVLNFAKLFTDTNTTPTPEKIEEIEEIEIVSTTWSDNVGTVAFRPSTTLNNPAYYIEVLNHATGTTTQYEIPQRVIRYKFPTPENGLYLVKIVDKNSQTSSQYSMIPNTEYTDNTAPSRNLKSKQTHNIAVGLTNKSHKLVNDFAAFITEGNIKIVVGAEQGTYVVSFSKKTKPVIVEVEVENKYGYTIQKISKENLEFLTKSEKFYKVEITKK